MGRNTLAFLVRGLFDLCPTFSDYIAHRTAQVGISLSEQWGTRIILLLKGGGQIPCGPHRQHFRGHAGTLNGPNRRAGKWNARHGKWRTKSQYCLRASLHFPAVRFDSSFPRSCIFSRPVMTLQPTVSQWPKDSSSSSSSSGTCSSSRSDATWVAGDDICVLTQHLVAASLYRITESSFVQMCHRAVHVTREQLPSCTSKIKRVLCL